MSARAGGIAAALLYLGLSLFTSRAVLVSPSEFLPLPTRHEKPSLQNLYKADQGFVVANISRMAQAFSRDPTRLDDPGLCAPMDRPYTLGEHMFGEGLLGAVPYVITQDPILTYNIVGILSTWISAMAMYALAFYWTRSVPAALVAGLLFGFHPHRLNNPAHLFVFGNAWTAIALLAAHRLFAKARWRDAALLSAALGLQLLESFYQVLALAIVGGTYGTFLLARHARALPALFPKLLAVGVFVAGVAWLVLGPYLETQSAWDVLQGRRQLLVAAINYLPGRSASPGWIAFLLASIGLLDRLRGPRTRDGDDPRIPLAVAGFLLFWCSVLSLRIPGLGAFPSPLITLGESIPGVNAVRVLAALQFGVWLLFAFFSAYGVLAIVERLPRKASVAVTVVLATAVVLQTFHPALSFRSFSTRAGLVAYQARPAEAELDQLRALPPGGVLDLPLDFKRGKIRLMPNYLLAAGYHREPVAACYNSFLSGLQTKIQQLTEALPSRRAARALSALGFTSIRIHHRHGGIGARLDRLLAAPGYTELVERTRSVSLYRLLPHPVTEDFSAIANATPPRSRASATPPTAGVIFRFVGAQGPTFRHPDPIVPSEVIVRWRDDTGPVWTETTSRVLLPPALDSGQHAQVQVDVDVPTKPGLYVAELVRAEEPGRILASRHVTVR